MAQRWALCAVLCILRHAVVTVANEAPPIWAQFGHDASHASTSLYVGPRGPTATVAWTFNAGAMVDASPAVAADGTVRDKCCCFLAAECNQFGGRLCLEPAASHTLSTLNV